jgi:DNA-3-methyladenine glycosylase II
MDFLDREICYRAIQSRDARFDGRPTALLQRAEAWRPWRVYAAQHLWAVDADTCKSRGNRHV